MHCDSLEKAEFRAKHLLELKTSQISSENRSRKERHARSLGTVRLWSLNFVFQELIFRLIYFHNFSTLCYCMFQAKVSFFFQCTKMQLITLQNFNIQTCFSQFLWFFSLKCHIISRIHCKQTDVF